MTPTLFWKVRDARGGARLVKERAVNGRRQQQSFFSYRVVQKWNLLPIELKMAPSLESFKTDWMSLLWTETRAKNEKKTKKTDLIYKDRDLRISDRVKLRNKRICYWRCIFILDVDV